MTPNPAHGPVTVEFQLGQDGPVALEVFDLAGRRVGSLARATLPAGRHALRWDPKSAGGQERGGILYARLVGGDRTDGRRFVLLP